MKTRTDRPGTDPRSESTGALKRRDFFKLLGGGIIIYAATANPEELLSLPLLQRREVPRDFNAFLRIDENGTVFCHTGKIEMGQGPITSLPQQIADELDVSIESVEMVMGDTLLCPYDAGTWGSLTTREFSHHLRAAGAEARAVLLKLASEKLGIPVEELDVKDGIVRSKSDPGITVSYGSLAKGQRIERWVDPVPPVKNAGQFHYVGQSRKHADGRIKVTGKAKYTADHRLPGMVYARVVRPESHQVKLESADTSLAEQIPGVEVIRDGDLIAVLHEEYETAGKAHALVKAISGKDPLDVNDKSIFDYLLHAPAEESTVESQGDPDAGQKASESLVESEYRDGYVAHSPIETHTALAQWEGDRVTVWASSQTPFGAQGDIARALGMDLDQVRVISPFLGGGFGGKIYHPQILEVVRIAKKAGKPVMLVYTRQEEFFMDYFRHAAVIKIRSGLSRGKITSWDYRLWFTEARGSEFIYHIPNARRIRYHEKSGQAVHPFPTGAWRAPGANTNTFARESHIDMMAAKAGVDPWQFRLDNLKDEKMVAVLKALAEKFGYEPSAGPSGRGIGMACGTDAGTCVAVMVRVKVDAKTGEVWPQKAVVSQDMGLCINPQGSIIQAEGCVTMGLGYALSENVEFQGGAVRTRNFDSYQLPLFSRVPRTIDTVILDRQDEDPQGGGEPAIICMGGAIANAIYDACGARVLEM
ncbi:MAG: molybdopterin cofactor-binding domain-containing protein, partial [Bacteroidales bacterium]